MEIKTNVVKTSWRVHTKRGLMYLVEAESAVAAAQKVKSMIDMMHDTILEVLDNRAEANDEK